MACNSADSTELIDAVIQQASHVREIGGFDEFVDFEQFCRDAIDCAQKLKITEDIIKAQFSRTMYKELLRVRESV